MQSTSPSASSAAPAQGHPKGLSALFFTEMWERLAFYLLLGILVLYARDTERGGLGLTTLHATEIFGTYMAFVYFTPFLGGLIADRYLGYRRAVLIGGLFMATGLFLLGVRGLTTLYAGLACLCVGNGLFKPNISAMVGNLYAPGDPRRDAGFNIFYMGINTGAALSALLSAPLRNLWSFNTAFIGAGVGLLISVTILLINWRKLEAADRKPHIDPRDVSLGKIFLTILMPAALFGVAGFFIGEKVELIKSTLGPITFAFITGMIPVGFYFVSLVLKATPEEKPGLAALLPVYLAGGAFFMILHLSGGLMTVFAEDRSSRTANWTPEIVQRYYMQEAMPSYYSNAAADLPRPSEDTLLAVEGDVEAMFGARRISESGLAAVQAKFGDVKVVSAEELSRDQAQWRFLVCNVYPTENVKVKESTDEHGVKRVSISLEPETAKSTRQVLLLRDKGTAQFPVLLVTQATLDKVFKNASASRLPPGKFDTLWNAELITSFLNPIFVVILTPFVVAFFTRRVKAGKPIGTAHKILYGMLITLVSVLIVAAAAYSGGDGERKVTLWWLVIYYCVITIGELCLSPMGLSLVTKLSPKRLVGLMLGGWFLSTAIGNKLSGFISGLEPTTMVFIVLAGAMLLVAGVIGALLPTLDRAIKKYGA